MTNRRKTYEVVVGDVKIGNNNDVSVQSMTNIATSDIYGNVDQIQRLVKIGCEMVRLEVSSTHEISNFAKIKALLREKGISIPLIADTHLSPKLARECLKVADKVRINAGNFSDKIVQKDHFSDAEFDQLKEKLQNELITFFEHAKSCGTPIRIGVNHGSLAKRVLFKYGNTPLAMWESAKECLEVAASANFKNVVLSFKSSDVTAMVASNRLACLEMDKMGWRFPVHLGVTESGDGEYARIKSAIGIGALLADGIGDTVRVSLTEDPENEISVAKNIMQACGVRRFLPEVISCPSCGRTLYDIQSVVQQVKGVLANFPEAIPMKIAVMGCIINGLGEANDADIAIVGNYNGTLSIYRSGACVEKDIDQHDIAEKFSDILVKCGTH